MTPDTFQLAMGMVPPPPLLPHNLEELGNRSPCLLPGLQAVALRQLVAGLDDESAADGPAVLGGLPAEFNRVGEGRYGLSGQDSTSPFPFIGSC